ncbi:MAG: FKBP-type peptidyl-prolyl cis-trans isomerase [Elusimicrobiota bacterium]|jgi:FKBP-type peptidyl-prolyl cis-trans isomerase|nr:FKBP-type peptidyl-prolyl cis-trans isomerase [Elusimicrobiota bacterium]
MKNFLLTLAAITSLILPAFAQEAQPPAQEAPAALESSDKTLYSLGYLLGDNLKKQLILTEDDLKAVSQGMRDSLLDRASQTDLAVYKPLIAKKYEEDSRKILENRKIEQNQFLQALAKNRKNRRVAIDGGRTIYINTIKEGKGKTPSKDSMVKVHYEGALLDGNVFDSSVKRGEPAQFPLSGVIACWGEGLTHVRAGSKVKLYCPPETAYGDSQAGLIPPGSLLVFDVELLEIIK